MIQRIQTLFLIAALALSSSHFYTTIVHRGTEVIKYSQNFSFMILSIIISFLLFISIFLYKKRMLQIRFSVFNIILMIGYQIWLTYKYFTAPTGSVFSVTVVFPVIAAILTFMAVRYIARDEALVRSVNSLRKVTRKNAKKRK
jgi:hypothetical protein